MYGLRYDDYFFAPLKFGVCHYGKSLGTPIERDTWYTITKLYKESIIRSMAVTTSADLAAASVKFALRSTTNNAILIPTFFADQTIATAQTDKALAFGTMFTTFKPDKFVFGDVIANTPAITTVKDFSLLELVFQVAGAVPPDALTVSFTYQMAYQG